MCCSMSYGTHRIHIRGSSEVFRQAPQNVTGLGCLSKILVAQRSPTGRRFYTKADLNAFLGQTVADAPPSPSYHRLLSSVFAGTKA